MNDAGPMAPYVIDDARSVGLVGLNDRIEYFAVTVVDPFGTAHYALARRDLIGKPTTFDTTCAEVAHEHPGKPLPIETVKAITKAARRHLDATTIEGTNE